MRLVPVLAATLLLAGCASAPADLYRPYVATPPPARELSAGWARAFSVETFAAPDGTALPYRLLRPATAPRERLPLVIVLHGSGSIGTDNVSQMGGFAAGWAEPAVAAKRRAIVAVPQVPTRSADYEADTDGLPGSRPGLSQPALLALVAQLAKDPAVDPDRIYLVGFSMGGSAALNLLLADPERFAGAVAFAPVPPPRGRAGELADIPLMLVHGDADTENPFAADAAFAAALRKAGGRPAFVVYRGMDHRVPADLLLATDDWRAWLFGQTRRR
ncbi:MAG: alpha/beta fold hydrolase [Caulobacter sp.]|nr:alpha/beta fold hydrolase [Caulobacter sp.]